ncbi:MAG: nitroreductase family protein [Rikenellaceae bacterium]
MNFISQMRSRYTTKVYSSEGKIPRETLDELKEIMRLSPSSINSQPWHFTFVESREALQDLAKISQFNAEKIENCAALVVISAESDADKFEERLRATSNEHALRYFTLNVKSGGKEAVYHWMRNQCYLSLGILLSACATMGIDSTPMEGIEPLEYDKYLGLTNHKTVVAVALGRRSPDDFNQPSLRPKERRELSEILRTI